MVNLAVRLIQNIQVKVNQCWAVRAGRKFLPHLGDEINLNVGASSDRGHTGVDNTLALQGGLVTQTTIEEAVIGLWRVAGDSFHESLPALSAEHRETHGVEIPILIDIRRI